MDSLFQCDTYLAKCDVTIMTDEAERIGDSAQVREQKYASKQQELVSQLSTLHALRTECQAPEFSLAGLKFLNFVSVTKYECN